MITLVSYWKAYRGVESSENNLEIICRLPDASRLQHVYVSSLDLEKTWKVKPRRSEEKITIAVPRHGKGTVIILSSGREQDLEAKL